MPIQRHLTYDIDLRIPLSFWNFAIKDIMTILNFRLKSERFFFFWVRIKMTTASLIENPRIKTKIQKWPLYPYMKSAWCKIIWYDWYIFEKTRLLTKVQNDHDILKWKTRTTQKSQVGSYNAHEGRIFAQNEWFLSNLLF